jgi:hypothetical protein
MRKMVGLLTHSIGSYEEYVVDKNDRMPEKGELVDFRLVDGSGVSYTARVDKIDSKRRRFSLKFLRQDGGDPAGAGDGQ